MPVRETLVIAKKQQEQSNKRATMKKWIDFVKELQGRTESPEEAATDGSAKRKIELYESWYIRGAQGENRETMDKEKPEHDWTPEDYQEVCRALGFDYEQAN